MLRNTLSFSFHHATSEIPFVSPLRLPESWVHGELDALPSKVEYTPGTNMHNVVLEGNQGSGSVNVVNATPTYGSNAFHVDLSNVPSRIEVTADWTEEKKHVVYDASQVVQEIDVDGFFSGQYFLAEIQDLPSNVEVYSNKTTTRFDGSLSASSPLSRVALVSPSGALPPESLPDAPNYIEVIDKRVDDRKDIYADLRDVEGLTWDVTLLGDADCETVPGLSAEVGLGRSVPGDLRFLRDGDCGKYADITLVSAPTSIGFTLQDGLIQYNVPDGAATNDLDAFVEGINKEGPDHRVVEYVDLQLNDLAGPLTFRIESAEENGGRALVDLFGGSVGLAQATVGLGDRVEGSDPRDQPPLDLAVDLDAQYLLFRMANDHAQKVPDVPDGLVSIYQDGADEYSVYVELRQLDSLVYSGGADENNPCLLDIDELSYNTLQLNRDLVMAYDVKKESACQEKDGQRERFLIELTYLPTSFRLLDGHVRSWHDLGFRLDLNGPLEKLRWHRPVGHEAVRFGAFLEDVPTGSTDVAFIFKGKAVDVQVHPQQGSVGTVSVGFSSHQEALVLALELSNVNLRFQFDADGDTGYSGVPVYLFFDTGGQYVSGSVRFYTHDYGAGFNIGGLWADGVQVYKHKPTAREVASGFLFGGPVGGAAASIPVRANGFMFVEPNVNPILGMEIKVGDKWYKVPRPLELFF